MLILCSADEAQLADSAQQSAPVHRHASAKSNSRLSDDPLMAAPYMCLTSFCSSPCRAWRASSRHCLHIVALLNVQPAEGVIKCLLQLTYSEMILCFQASFDEAPAAVEATAGSDVGCQDDCMHVKMLSLSNWVWSTSVQFKSLVLHLYAHCCAVGCISAA